MNYKATRLNRDKILMLISQLAKKYIIRDKYRHPELSFHELK